MHQWRSYSIWLLVHKTLIPTQAFLLTLFVTEGGGILLSTFDLNTVPSFWGLVKIDLRWCKGWVFFLNFNTRVQTDINNEWQIVTLYSIYQIRNKVRGLNKGGGGQLPPIFWQNRRRRRAVVAPTITNCPPLLGG